MAPRQAKGPRRISSLTPSVLPVRLALPIGSGMIESSHGHILQSRMKKNGMAWTLENAQPMVQLRVLRANGQWNQYWRDQAARHKFHHFQSRPRGPIDREGAC